MNQPSLSTTLVAEASISHGAKERIKKNPVANEQFSWWDADPANGQAIAPDYDIPLSSGHQDRPLAPPPRALNPKPKNYDIPLSSGQQRGPPPRRDFPKPPNNYDIPLSGDQEGPPPPPRDLTPVSHSHRRRRASDPLGNSLHSYRPRRSRPTPGDFDDSPDGARPRRALRNRPSARARSGEGLVRVSGRMDHDDMEPEVVKHTTSFSRRARKFHKLAYSSDKKSDLDVPMIDDISYPVRKKSLSAQRAIALLCFVALLVSLYVHGWFRYSTASLQKRQYKAGERTREYDFGRPEKGDLSSKILRDGTGGTEIADRTYRGKIDSLSAKVEVLQSTIQQSSSMQLAAAFPNAAKIGLYGMEVVITLEGFDSPLVLQLHHEGLPYTTWTWLNQVRLGYWDNAKISVFDNEFFELTPVLPGGESTNSKELRDTRLNFRESSVLGGERYVVGLRNPDHGVNQGLVLTIHWKEGTCGHLEGEACFGKAVGGLDSLRFLRSHHHPVRALTTKVREKDAEK